VSKEAAVQAQPPLYPTLKLSCHRGIFPAHLLDKVLQEQTFPNSLIPLMVAGCHIGIKQLSAVQGLSDTLLLNIWMSSVNFTNLRRQLRNSGRGF